MKSHDYSDLIHDAESSPEYWAEVAIGDFTDEICRLLEERKVSRSALARKLGTSAAYITKVLRGNANFTLTSMARLAFALDSQVRVHLAPQGSYSVWKDVFVEPTANWLNSFSTDFIVPSAQEISATVEPWTRPIVQPAAQLALGGPVQATASSVLDLSRTGEGHDPGTAAA